MKINPNIFKAYDIRGRYPEEIDKSAFLKIGIAFGKLTKAKKIVVGRDIRLSSESLTRFLISGLLSQNIKVIDIGLCSTPAFYFAVNKLNFPAGLMVSASHLEKKYNGVKGVFKNALPLSRKEVLRWKQIALKNDEIRVRLKPQEVIKKDITKDYIASLKCFLRVPLKKYKIVMDTGNAMAGLYLKQVFKQINLDIVYLFSDLDGNFPNRGLNPKLPENRERLVKKIRKIDADLGFLWDGDADRFYVLDNRGKVIDPNFVSALISKYLVTNSKNKKVVVDIRTAKVVKDFVESVGGEVIQCPSWHPEVKFAMRTSGAIFGSETSGHYIFKDFYYIDDGILAAIFFLRAISAEKESLRKILHRLRNKYFILEEENFPIKKREKTIQILKNLERYYRKGKIIKIDGLRVDFPNWYFNLRLSETEPFLRLNLGADSKEIIKEKRNEIMKILKGKKLY